jgi:hypothetical protein
MDIIINPNQVKQVYSGKPGCACGCKGNYSENPKTIKTIVNRMREALKNGTATEVMFGGVITGFLSVETATRSYTAYLAVN